ncbi:hypothetical protein MN0502_21390 [Arthrobacter sp. MN05-02]|nr:hypothetical protein MN0502_21390 [Arthrobacter sp. MN05-02]
MFARMTAAGPGTGRDGSAADPAPDPGADTGLEAGLRLLARQADRRGSRGTGWRGP